MRVKGGVFVCVLGGRVWRVAALGTGSVVHALGTALDTGSVVHATGPPYSHEVLV